MSGSRLDKYNIIYTGVPKVMLPLGENGFKWTIEAEKIRAKIREKLETMITLMREIGEKCLALDEEIKELQKQYREELLKNGRRNL